MITEGKLSYILPTKTKRNNMENDEEITVNCRL